MEKKGLIIQAKMLMLAFIPILPWMIIGKFYNWRGYSPSVSQITSFDSMSTYFSLIPMQTSWIVFILFLSSILFVLIKKRNILSFFFGALFVAYYLFYTADFTVKYEVHRFSAAFYPSIAVYLALFLSYVIDKVKWKHAYKAAILVISFYLIILCTDPSSRAELLLKRTLQFPSEPAMHWVKENVKDGEKIMLVRILPSRFYIDKLNIDKSKVLNYWYVINDVSTPEKLKRMSVENDVTYIMLPMNRAYLENERLWPGKEIYKYLRERSHDAFTEVSKFSIDENYIYIFKTNIKREGAEIEQ